MKETTVHVSIADALEAAQEQTKAHEGTFMFRDLIQDVQWCGKAFSGLCAVLMDEHLIFKKFPDDRRQGWAEDGDEAHYAWETIGTASAILTMGRDYQLLADQLQTNHFGVFEEYDRYRAEAEIRYSIFPPLVLMAVAFTILWHWYVIFVILILLVLPYSGRRSELRARSLLARALRQRLVKSPTLELVLGRAAVLDSRRKSWFRKSAKPLRETEEEWRVGELVHDPESNMFQQNFYTPIGRVETSISAENLRALTRKSSKKKIAIIMETARTGITKSEKAAELEPGNLRARRQLLEIVPIDSENATSQERFERPTDAAEGK